MPKILVLDADVKSLLALTVVLATNAGPASAARQIIDGGELFEFCVSGVQANNDALQTACAGYIWGIVDYMYRNDREWIECVGLRSIGQESRQVVTDYLKAHPEHRDLPGLEQVRLALFSAYCPGE